MSEVQRFQNSCMLSVSCPFHLSTSPLSSIVISYSLPPSRCLLSPSSALSFFRPMHVRHHHRYPRLCRFRRTFPYRSRFPLHLCLVDSSLLSHRLLDMEPCRMDLSIRWIGFRRWDSSTYLFGNGEFGDFVVFGKEKGLWNGEIGV